MHKQNTIFLLLVTEPFSIKLYIRQNMIFRILSEKHFMLLKIFLLFLLFLFLRLGYFETFHIDTTLVMVSFAIINFL